MKRREFVMTMPAIAINVNVHNGAFVKTPSTPNNRIVHKPNRITVDNRQRPTTNRFFQTIPSSEAPSG